MTTLTFGCADSIAYKEAKVLEGLKAFDEHWCECKFCEYQGWECPYGCETTEEPDLTG